MKETSGVAVSAMLELAREWVRTYATRDDVALLGLEQAANHHLGLLWRARVDGDEHWRGLLPVGVPQKAVMMAALAEFCNKIDDSE